MHDIEEANFCHRGVFLVPWEFVYGRFPQRNRWFARLSCARGWTGARSGC
jgi:hypothetical protein